MMTRKELLNLTLGDRLVCTSNENCTDTIIPRGYYFLRGITDGDLIFVRDNKGCYLVNYNRFEVAPYRSYLVVKENRNDRSKRINEDKEDRKKREKAS